MFAKTAECLGERLRSVFLHVASSATLGQAPASVLPNDHPGQRIAGLRSCAAHTRSSDGGRTTLAINPGARSIRHARSIPLPSGFRMRSTANADGRSHITLHSESLDLSGFLAERCEASLLRHFKDRYRDIPIGTVVAVGAAAVELVLRWRSELWPAIPVVFAMVDEIDFVPLQPPAGSAIPGIA